VLATGIGSLVGRAIGPPTQGSAHPATHAMTRSDLVHTAS
jgi:hypothetical protein